MTTSQQQQHISDLEKVAADRADLEHRQFAAVLDARLAGVSWAKIGAALGVSAQAVQQRYAPTSTKP